MIKDFFKYRYNLNIKPYFDRDLRKIHSLSSKKYPFSQRLTKTHIIDAINWLYHTNELVNKNGFPSKFSFGANYGLSGSYPEVTGYTLCTLLTIIRNKPLKDYNYSIINELIMNSYKYLLTTQLENGSFMAGNKNTVNYGEISIFNTGQILLGLADLYESVLNNKIVECDFVDEKVIKYSIDQACKFLTTQIDEDGSYNIRYTYTKKKKTYNSRTSYGLLRGGIVLNNKFYIDSALRNFNWVSSQCQPNGLIKHWGLQDNWSVLHTISYTLRGLIEAGIYYNNDGFIKNTINGIKFLTSNISKDFMYKGLIPSYFNDKGFHNDELCITGLSQLAIVIKKIPENKRPKAYDDLFKNIINDTKRFQLNGFDKNIYNGAIPASIPFSGEYQANSLIEWGLKFFIDSLLLYDGVKSSEVKG